MYFILSKTLAFFVLPSNLLVLAALAGTALLFTKRIRAGRALLVVSMLGFVILGLSPIGKLLFYALESRFPPWDASGPVPTGFIVLGGSIDPDISQAHNQVALTDAAERLTVAADLAKRYPKSRIIFSGGNGTLFGGALEATYAVQLLTSFGVPPERIEAEARSRNTIENAAFTKEIAAPHPSERWVVITSAFHMPRAMAAFRGVGFDVEAYPVDWQIGNVSTLFGPFRSFMGGLSYTDWATREFVGMLSYRLTGRSKELFAGPR